MFAGLGGFHVALRRLGHECVLASEIDPTLRALYAKNFALLPHGDIRKVPLSEFPTHPILSTGLPCKPFSKPGRQKGLDDPRYSILFDNVIEILQALKRDFLILMNIPNP